MFLALDLGTTTGWCLADYEKTTKVISGFKKLVSYKSSIDRFPNFLTLLNEIYRVSEKKLSKIYYEKNMMSYKNVYANYIHGGFLAVLEVWTSEKGMPMVGMSCLQIRKEVFGKGNIPKVAILPTIQEIHPHVSDHNEADAVALALYVKKLNNNN